MDITGTAPHRFHFRNLKATEFQDSFTRAKHPSVTSETPD
ncbi:hypothetical protein RHCRD62_80147 [Rhodococcus sp. RD6.2]|nr:hypothetical protein RHCRD62_80147 [Rhodococcus sp. RD6.2]